MSQVLLNEEQQTLFDNLKKNLQGAAELEHQFTCMYLFSAFSLKKYPDAHLSLADVEVTRRWASVIYMVARQEMEHLAIVNQLLGAIGEPPCFDRANIPHHSDFFRNPYTSEPQDKKALLRSTPPQAAESYEDKRVQKVKSYLEEFLPKGTAIDESVLKDYVNGKASEEELEALEKKITDASKLVPASIPFLFTPFDLRAARRFAVMEGPLAIHLVLTGQRIQAANLFRWGFEVRQKTQKFYCILPDGWYVGESESDKKKRAKGLIADDVKPGDIERYYNAVKEAFEQLGDVIFVPASEGRQVKILSQYDIYIFPINDVASAKNGIELIIAQGEAVGSSPGYDSHFRHFYDIAETYEKKLGIEHKDMSTLEQIRSNCAKEITYTDFVPFLDVMPNPKRSNFDAKDANHQFLLKIFDLFNYGYKSMCYCLNGLYGWYKETEDYPFLIQSLRDIVFAPTMTMIIRTVGELLVAFPLKTIDGRTYRAAPNFDMEDAANQWEALAHPVAGKYKKKYIAGPKDKQRIIDTLYMTSDVGEIRRKYKKDAAATWQNIPEYGFYRDLDFYLERFETIVKAVESIRKDAENGALSPMLSAEEQIAIRKRIEFLYQNVHRLTANLWKTYQSNVNEHFRAIK